MNICAKENYEIGIYRCYLATDLLMVGMGYGDMNTSRLSPPCNSCLQYENVINKHSKELNINMSNAGCNYIYRVHTTKHLSIKSIPELPVEADPSVCSAVERYDTFQST